MSTENTERMNIIDALPCIQCQNEERRALVLCRLAKMYFELESGKLPQVPSRAQLFNGCCKRIQSFTFENRGPTVVVR